MFTKLIYKTELDNIITKHHCITSLHNIVIKQGYVKQLRNVVTQRRDETLYRAAVLALYQTKVRRSGRLYHFTRLKRRSARSARPTRHHTTPHLTRAYIRAWELELEKGAGAGGWSWNSCCWAAGAGGCRGWVENRKLESQAQGPQQI